MPVTYVFLDCLCFYLFNPKVPPLIRGVIFLTQPIGITVNPYHSPSSSLVVAIRTSSSSWLIKYPYDQKMGVFVSSDFSHPDVDIISTHSTSTYRLEDIFYLSICISILTVFFYCICLMHSVLFYKSFSLIFFYIRIINKFY